MRSAWAWACAAFAAGAHASADCDAIEDCYLNGDCVSGTCRCHPGWTGIHCGQFDLLPTPPGPLGAKAFPPAPDSSCWGSSVIKGRDGKYHMYASGIEGKCGLAVWSANAALTHAVSDTIDGLFEPREDIMRGSNPAINEFQGELRLWHTLAGGPGGPGTKGFCSTCTNGSTPSACRNESVGAFDSAPVSSKLVVASDPAGPWTNVNISCRGWAKDGGDGCPTTSNPTAHYFANGTTLLQYDWQKKGSHTVGFFLAKAPDVRGPYTPVSGDWNKTTITWSQNPGGSPACTDPFLWRDVQGAFHSVFHCRNWFPGPAGDAGGHAFSADGVRWTLAPEPCWNLTVIHTDGSNTTFWHRERPQVFIDPDSKAPAALINAVSLANQNQPFPWQKGCPPHPSHIQAGCDQSMAYVQRIRG